MLAVLDAGPLYAAADGNDDYHQSSLDLLKRPDIDLVVPMLVVGEVAYLIGRRLGPAAEANFFAGIPRMSVLALSNDEWARIAELVRQYADFPLGGTDASVVALAERLNTDLVITLDHRHFRASRPRHCPALRLLPERV